MSFPSILDQNLSPIQMIGNFLDFISWEQNMFGSWNLVCGGLSASQISMIFWPEIQTRKAPSGDPAFQTPTHPHRGSNWQTLKACNFWSVPIQNVQSGILVLLAEAFPTVGVNFQSAISKLYFGSYLWILAEWDLLYIWLTRSNEWSSRQNVRTINQTGFYSLSWTFLNEQTIHLIVQW